MLDLFRKTHALGTACKYVVAFILLTAVLFMAEAAGAAETGITQEGAQPPGVTTPDPDSIYKPTPIGPESVPYGEGSTGPNHLRRMSPTEALPAEPQIEKVVPIPNYGVSEPGGY